MKYGKTRQIDSVLHDYAQDFFLSNSCLKITRQIELVLQYFAYECCNLTIFSNQIAIKLLFKDFLSNQLGFALFR